MQKREKCYLVVAVICNLITLHFIQIYVGTQAFI